MGREYVRISLGGVRDEADIRGHRRTYVGAMPGRIIQGMKQAGTANPVFLLDEVDKLGVSYQGDPSAALLEVLDPAQNDTFTDHYLGVPFDLSEVLFIATANFIQNIPAPLLDRMEVVEFSGYTEGEKLEIARRFLLPRQLSEAGLTDGQLTVTDDALAATITGYTREAGVRQLEREIGRLARKVARRIAAGEIERATLDAAEVRRLLGRPKVHPEHAAVADQVGVATGMYYTPMGGDIMFVEASTMRGKGELVLTGQLGDVMKESARAAWSYARAHAEELGIDEAAFERDVHVHVPAGAIPKDGPSAGVTMTVALVSALAGRPCPVRPRDDRGDHALGPGAADRGRQGEGARRGARRDHDDPAAAGQRGRPRGPPGRGAATPHGAHGGPPRRGAGDRAARRLAARGAPHLRRDRAPGGRHRALMRPCVRAPRSCGHREVPSPRGPWKHGHREESRQRRDRACPEEERRNDAGAAISPKPTGPLRRFAPRSNDWRTAGSAPPPADPSRGSALAPE